LPKEYRTPRMDRLQSAFAGIAGDFTKLTKPTDADLQLMGRYIQIYNFIELNLRRSIEVFARAGLLEASAARKHHKLAPSALTPTLKASVAVMDPVVEDVPDSLGKLDEIEFRRGFRNIMAHWAARRVPGEDALVFMSKDGRDEKQISGEDKVQVDYARTAILDLADVRGLADHMIHYETWIAVKTSEWYRRYIPADEGSLA
jgi:hypothetical protein